MERAKLSNTLADFPDEDNLGRYPVVQQIKALTKQIAATYQQPTPDSQPPATTDDFPKDRLEALKKLHNTRSNITKWTKKRDDAADPNTRAKAEQKLTELHELKNRLDAFIQEAEGKD